MKIAALLIDGDTDSRMAVDNYIKNNAAEILIAGHAASVKEAVAMIGKLRPDLLVLDILLPDGTAFDLLAQLPEKDFEVLFVTGFDAFAVQAFKCSAFDYILKPVSLARLGEALFKVEERIKKKYFVSQWNLLLQALHRERDREKRIAIATADGFVFADVKRIVRMESHSNYTHFYFTDGKKMISSHTLGFYEAALSLMGFCRIHHSHLVNIAFVSQYAKNGACGTVIMEGGVTLPVSQRRKEAAMKQLLKGRTG